MAEITLPIAVLCVVLGVFFCVTGLLKVLGNDHMVREFKKFGYPQWLRMLTGWIEVVAGPLLLTSFWWPAAAGFGALIMCPVMVGAAYTNFVKRPAVFGWGTVVILVLCCLPVIALWTSMLALVVPVVPGLAFLMD